MHGGGLCVVEWVCKLEDHSLEFIFSSRHIGSKEPCAVLRLAYPVRPLTGPYLEFYLLIPVL